jgi:putative intracellular protease/amidase
MLSSLHVVLRRAEIEVDVVSIEKNGQEPVKCSRNVRIVPDKSLDAVKSEQYDCVVVPGGNEGASNQHTLSLCKTALEQAVFLP